MADVAPEQGVVVHLHGAFVSSLGERLASVCEPEEDDPPTIFKIPARLREAHRKHFEPKVVSIGPYHRGHKNLQTMEELKWQYLKASLSRNPGISLADCIEKIKAMETRARKFYAGSIGLNSNEFIEMLLLDGCFMLETVHRWNSGKLDATLRLNWLSDIITEDFFLLENQIPFFVLENLFDLLMVPQGESSLPEFLVQNVLGLPLELVQLAFNHRVHHLLHLSHTCYCYKYIHNLDRNEHGIVPSHPVLNYVSAKAEALVSWFHSCLGRIARGSSRPHSGSSFSGSIIPCATELQDAGIKFREKQSDNILDITFKDGTLEIPKIFIYNDFISRCMNFAVFEQYLSPEQQYVTSFAVFLDCIINTGKDVAILYQCGVIENHMGSDEEAASFFNQLSDFTYMNSDEHYLVGVFRDVNKYCKSDLHKWRAGLARNYFNNPWAILSLLAAIILLILTFLQSFFAIYAYFRPPS